LQEILDSVDFAELLAYMQSVEPVGEDRADARAALISNTIARSAGAKTKVSDFLLNFTPKEPETPAEKSARIKAGFAEARACREAVKKGK
jgi:hypothetical protein